jgi:hypothetical protein
MHEVMVGVRVDERGCPLFFGWDEVNEYVHHGMKVVRLEPGDVFGGQSIDQAPNEWHLGAWYFKVVLDDSGIHPA